MKKFISAATSIAMAATIVGAAVPFTSGAAVEGKTLELRPFNGASATISADAIAAGDVTIPVGLYVVEKAADSQTISAQFTINTKDGDASGITFGDKDSDGKYMAIEPKGDLPAAIDYTLKDGSSINYDKLITFAGAMKESRGKLNFSYANGSQVYDIANEGYSKANAKNAFSSCAWTAPQGGYTWTDAGASDTFPMYVVNVTFPKGTKNGTYSLEFCDYAKNADVMSNLIEVGTTKLDTKQGGLTLKGLDIKVGDGGSTPVATTQAPTDAPVVTTQAPTDAPVQPTTNGGSDVASQGQKDFIVKPGTYTVSEKDDENYIDVMVDAGSHKVGLQAIKLDTSKLPKGITIDEPEEESAATGKSWKESNGQYILETLKGGDTVTMDTTQPVISFHYSVDKSVAPGKYEFTFSRWHVAEKSDTEYDATIEKGYIIVPGETTTEPSTQPVTPGVTTAPVTQPTTDGGSTDPIAQQGQKDFIVKPGTYTVKAADDDKDSYIDVMVDAGSHKVGLQAIKLDTSKLPAGITIDEPEEESAATGKSWKESNGQYILETLKGGDTVTMDTTQPVISFHFSVADTVAPGKYEFTFSRWHVAEKSDTEYDATIEKGYIIVEGDTVTTPPVSSTAAPTTVAPTPTTTTTAPVVVVPTTTAEIPTNVVYGDVNCDGKVSIADTVILSKWLTASDSITITAQGLLNADCCDPTGTAKPDSTDSDAILKAIVHNVVLPCKAADVK